MSGNDVLSPEQVAALVAGAASWGSPCYSAESCDEPLRRLAASHTALAGALEAERAAHAQAAARLEREHAMHRQLEADWATSYDAVAAECDAAQGTAAELRGALEAAHDALDRAALRLQVLGDYPSPRDAFAARDAARYALDGGGLSDAAQAARGGEAGQ